LDFIFGHELRDFRVVQGKEKFLLRLFLIKTPIEISEHNPKQIVL
jgi:hypothetical protein